MFRLSILYPREVGILKGLNTPQSLGKAERLERDSVDRPVLIATLNG